MSKRMKVAFGCHALALLIIAAVGVIYLSRTQFMPYHAVALGRSWADVDQVLQILLLALIRALGGACLATAFAMGILLVIPFRKGVFWARWAIPVVGLVAQLPLLYATLSVALNTPATPPWKGVLLIIVLLITGFILSVERKREKGAVA
jgi:hypothetical protein